MNLKKIHLILFLKPCYKWNTFNTSTFHVAGFPATVKF